MFQDCRSEDGAVYGHALAKARVVVYTFEAVTYLLRYQSQFAAPCSSTWMLSFCEGGNRLVGLATCLLPYIFG